jgi:hypothetical protein
MSALTRSINIPAVHFIGYYAGTGHASTAWKSVGYVLGHGDDLYNAALTDAPGVNLLDSYQYWVDYIFPHGPSAGTVTRLLTGRLSCIKAMTWISGYTQNRFCLPGGWADMEAGYAEYFAVSEQWRLDQFYDDLVALTGCDGINF